jgi:nicotinamide riboside kinase
MLNLNKVGRPLCKVEKGKYNGYIVSVSDQQPNEEEDNEELIKEFKRLKIPNDSRFQHMPDTTREREILYITGCSGSGKSTYTRKFIEQLKKAKKDIPIYLFSALPDDESLDSVKPLRIQLDESLIEDPIDIKEFADSVVLFDDIDVIPDKKIREAVYKIMNMGLEIGRHYKINMVITNHLPTNGRDTRRILNEASSFTYFPHSANAKIKYFLTEYVGVDKKMITYFKKQNTRAVTIFKNYPMCYLCEREVGLLNAAEDDDD